MPQEDSRHQRGGSSSVSTARPPQNALYALSLLLAITLLTACTDPTANLPEAQVNEPSPDISLPDTTPDAPHEPAATAQLALQTYTLTEDSTIGFEGFTVTGSHIGGFGAFDGAIKIPEAEIDAAVIEVLIDMTSTYSDAPALTKVLIGPAFFDVEKHPMAEFRSTAIVHETGDAYKITGNLTLRGITKNITFPATIRLTRESMAAEAEFTISRTDFGIEYSGLADDFLREKVLILLDVEAIARAR